MEEYYYEKLTKERKNVYYPLLSGLRSVQASIEVPTTDRNVLSDVFAFIRLDHPEIFYAPTYRFRSVQGGSTFTVMPEYLFDRKKIRTHMEAMRSRVEKLARPARDFSEEEKFLFVHDFICSNVRYDKLKKEYSHEIIGPLGQGVGVCEGIAKTVKALCDALGVWCIVAISDNNPEKGIKYRHTWNVVRLDGRYYHLDVTFDNSLGEPGQIRYDYFLLSDAQHYRDHEPSIWPLPACSDGGRFYYRTKKLSFTKEEDIRKRAAQALKKDRTLIFHWRGSILTREALRELTRLLEDEAEAAGRTVCVTVNRPQAVIRMIPQRGTHAELVLENANEGEEDAAGTE